MLRCILLDKEQGHKAYPYRNLPTFSKSVRQTVTALSSGSGCGHDRGSNKRMKYFYLLLLLKEEISTIGKKIKKQLKINSNSFSLGFGGRSICHDSKID